MTRVVRSLRGERGYTLIEMLTVVSILGVILTGLTALFVQGSNAQLDMNRRFESQERARLALDKMRREIHCSQGATTTPVNTLTAAVTLNLPSQCPTAVGGAQTNVTWCTVSVATGRWALYRKVGTTCDSTGTRWADHVTASTIFQYQAAGTTTKGRLYVNIPIDLKTTDTARGYVLCDQITLRNTTRTDSTTPSRLWSWRATWRPSGWN